MSHKKVRKSQSITITASNEKQISDNMYKTKCMIKTVLNATFRRSVSDCVLQSLGKAYSDYLQIIRVVPGCPRYSLRCKKVGVRVLVGGPENWHFSYLTAPSGQAPGVWAQTYHCGGGAAGLSLRGAGTDRA